MTKSRAGRRLAVGCVAGVLVLAPMGARATHGATEPILYQERGIATGWISTKIVSDGTPITLEISANNASHRQVHGGLATYSPTGVFGGATFFWYFEDGTGTVVEVGTAPDTVEIDQRAPDPGYAWFMAAGINQPGYPAQVGTKYVVLWWSGDLTFDLDLRTARGNQIAGMHRGDSAFYATALDLDTVAGNGTHVTTPLLPQASVGTKAVVQGTYEFAVENHFVGVLAAHGGTAGSFAVTEPGGRRGCGVGGQDIVSGQVFGSLCQWDGLTPGQPHYAAPGTYTLEVTYAGAGALHFEEIFFGGADITLPV